MSRTSFEKEIENFVAIPKLYLIANLDILGVQNKLLHSNEKENTVILTKLNHFMEEAKNGSKETFGLVHALDTICFSDNIVVTLEANDKNNDFVEKCHYLILYVMTLQIDALTKGFLLRGSIKFGELFIDKNKNFICGKGLVETYAQESNLAVFPRIITMDCELLKIIEDIKLNNEQILKDVFRKDVDDIYYLDYMQLLSITPKLTNELVLKVKNNYIKYLASEREINEQIKQKHDWHINYFNNFCDRVSLPEYKIEVANASN